MKCVGQLTHPSVSKYYVTGSLEQKIENKALQEMLRKIKNGGMQAFLNDKELGKFARGMRESFITEKLINADNTLTASGDDVVKTGKAWRGFEGAFFFTVLLYDDIPYLLDAELVDGKSTVDFQETEQKLKFNDSMEYLSSFRRIRTDSQWAKAKSQPQNASVKFSFDYENENCKVDVSWKDDGKNKKCSFNTGEESTFAILKRETAMKLLEERENEENCFEFSYQDKTAIQIHASNANHIAEKNWLTDFFKNGSFILRDVVFPEHKAICEIQNVYLYIDTNDTATLSVLLNEYLLRKAETSYLGYAETGHLVNEFQNLFTSPDGKFPACPAVMQQTKEIYNSLMECAKELSKTNPLAYLHLQAYIDLAPEDTIKPYIEKEYTVNLTNQELSFMDLVQKVFGEERNIKAISAFSKYTATNGRNARAFMFFAESIERNYGINTTLVTTKEEVRASSNNAFKGSNKKWYEQMKNSVSVIEKPVDDIKTIHDRYYKVVRTDGNTEWWVLTGELDSLRFRNDHPRIREDVTVMEPGTVKEMTFSRIKESGVPAAVVQLMEAK